MSDRKIDPAIIFVAVIALLVVGLGVFIFLQVRTDDLSTRLDTGQAVPVLLTVTDGGVPILSHVLILSPKTKRVALVDIPENLGAIFDSLNRVDSYEVYFREKGIDEYRMALAKMLDQAIPFHILMTKEQVSTLVDLLNGLPVFVADSIDSTKGKQFVRIPSGNIVLDGEKLVSFITYREAEEHDQERSNRRWVFTKALLSRLGEEATRLQSGKFLQLVYKQMTTNMEDRAFANFCKLMAKVDPNTMITQRIIGTTRLVDTKDGQKNLLFPHFEGQLVKDSMRQILANLESADDPKDGAGMIRIEILNGTAVPGMAKKTKDLFQSYGFEVLSMGNASSTDQATTMVIDRRGNPALAERTAKIIKCERVSTQVEAGGNQDVDVTVILGKDFDGWNVKNK